MTKKAKVWLIIAIVAVIGIALAIINSSMLKEKSNVSAYKIGAVLPLTGGTAHLGTSMQKGMEFAAEEINNNGGINGHKIKVITQDGKMDGMESVSAANFLLNIENPDVFSVLFAPPAQAISPILKEAKKPMIYEAFIYSILDENPYAFKTNFDPVAGCEKLVKYAKEHNQYTKLGVMMPLGEWTDLCLEGIKKVEPSVAEYLYALDDSDYKTNFTKAYNNGIDGLVTIPVFDPINMFKQFSELGYPIKIFTATASESIYPAVAEAASTEALDGILGIDIVPANLAETEFGKNYSSKYNNPDNVEYAYAAMGYEEVQFIAEAMKNCDPGDSKCLSKELEKVKEYNTVIGSNGFKNRVLQMDTTMYEYRNGWNKVE
ncbi:MAG: ABC transporter substrate-binding protein [Patescibacteria group bacterium]